MTCMQVENDIMNNIFHATYMFQLFFIYVHGKSKKYLSKMYLYTIKVKILFY